MHLALLLALALPPGGDPGAERAETRDVLDVHVPRAPQTLSKKQAWLEDKALRAAGSKVSHTVRMDRPIDKPVVTLFNVWTREALPVLTPDAPPQVAAERRLDPFLRDHTTNQSTRMDPRLLDVLTRAARKFGTPRIEVVSGYRSPKYNLSLRKKGHEVARSSQHCEGHAVDFRIRGVPTKTLLRFVKSLRRGGVGFYPHSQFVHCDTGPIRYWKGS